MSKKKIAFYGFMVVTKLLTVFFLSIKIRYKNKKIIDEERLSFTARSHWKLTYFGNVSTQYFPKTVYFSGKLLFTAFLSFTSYYYLFIEVVLVKNNKKINRDKMEKQEKGKYNNEQET